MKRKLSYFEIALLIVFCLIAATIYSERTREPYEKGLIYGAKGKFEVARETFAGVTDVNPRYILSVRQLKMMTDDVLEGRVEKEAAIHVFRGAQYHTRYQTHEYNGIEIYRMVFKKGYEPRSVKHLKKAIEEYKKAIAINPNIAVAHHALGKAYAWEFRNKAIEEYKKAIAIDPDESLTHFFLGSVYHHRDMPDEAIKEMKEAEILGIEPTSHRIYVQIILGREYHRTGKYDLAVKHYEKAIELGHRNKSTIKLLNQAKAALKKE